jgi:hypothetical protein
MKIEIERRAAVVVLTALLTLPCALAAQDPASKPASKPEAGSESKPATDSAPLAGPVGDLGPAPRGAAPIFDKKEREGFVKVVKEFLKVRGEFLEAKNDGGADNPNYKSLDKKLKTAETALRNYLKPIAKKYSLDSECLGAAADWQSAVSEFLVGVNKYNKSDKSLGSEQLNTLREGPKNTYTRRIPKGYDPVTKSWPLLIMVQDKAKHSKLITTEEFKNTALLDGEGEFQGHVTISVDVPESAWDDPRKLFESVLLPMREVRGVLRIDPNRIVVGGVGEGARAAIQVARFAPHFFSGVVVKGGDPGDVRPENIVNLPVYLMGDASGWEKAGSDGGQGSWVARAKAVGVDLTQDPESKLPSLVAWLAKRVRNPYAPRAVSVVKSDKRQSAAFWLYYDPDPSKEAVMEARIHRDTNTIEIACEGVTRYYLFLSDGLLDLSKLVKIKTNDKEWSGKLPPVFATFLGCLDEFGNMDRGGIYTVKHVVDVPRAKKE